MRENIDLTKLPTHIAIIMDGNGRWAQKKGLSRSCGHQEGVVALRKVVAAAGDIGIGYLTVYAFSTENWNRPQEEVDALMAIMVMAIQQETPDLMKNNVQLRVMGDLNRLPQDTYDNLMNCIEQTANNTGLVLNLALSYSSRWEITEMTKQLANQVKSGFLDVESITEELISEHLTTKDIPDPDLLIRTGGECRISNFLMWQLSYSELYFTDLYWPEFDAESLFDAIRDYQNRQRRFGKTGEQVDTQLS